MSPRCTHENCFPDTTCALGHLDRSNCEFWKEQESTEEESVDEQKVPTSDIPWNGYALGTSDLAILSGRGRPLVVGMVGAADSGKTSLLAFLYMWLLRYGKIGDWRFAGSWTLGGWELVAQYCRWIGDPPPSFPPHTSSTGRHPGMLHVTIRHLTRGRMRDMIFTDAPGEWFTQWSRVPDDPTAAGARWVIDHSDVLLLLIDSEALADSDKLPQARRSTRDLLERAGVDSPYRQKITVWTKDDIEVPDQVRNGIERACCEFLPHSDTWKTTIYRPETIEQCFARAILAAEGAILPFKVVEPRRSSDPFLAFRGIHAKT